MKAIYVNSDTEFERLLEHISVEAHRASNYWRLLKGLDAAIDDHLEEFNQSQAFWGSTFRALGDDVLFHINRLYDKTAGSISLGNFLLTIRSKVQYFSEQSFVQRMQRNPSNSASFRVLNPADLAGEILQVSDSDPLVKRLHQLRNRYLSHRDAALVRLANLSSIAGLTSGEIDSLIERAIDLVNKYSLIYRASLMSAQVVGADDYKHLLRFLKLGLAAFMAKTEEEHRRLRTQASIE